MRSKTIEKHGDQMATSSYSAFYPLLRDPVPPLSKASHKAGSRREALSSLV